MTDPLGAGRESCAEKAQNRLGRRHARPVEMAVRPVLFWRELAENRGKLSTFNGRHCI